MLAIIETINYGVYIYSNLYSRMITIAYTKNNYKNIRLASIIQKDVKDGGK